MYSFEIERQEFYNQTICFKSYQGEAIALSAKVTRNQCFLSNSYTSDFLLPNGFE